MRVPATDLCEDNCGGYRSELLKERNRHVVEPKKLLQFDEVHPPLPGLTFGHKGLRLAYGFGDLSLGQAGLLPSLP